MKRGFTLVELLAVIIILGIIALITFPIVDKSIENSKQAALERTIDSIEEAAHNYSSQNNLGYSINEKTISLDELKSSGFLNVDITNPVTNEEMAGCVIYKWDEVNNQYIFRYDEACRVEYVDNSGANKPKLYNNMIPVKYDGTSWIYADTKEAWYDYNAKEWANAVVLNSGVTKNVGDTITESEVALWYVWIPRYTYTIFNGNNEGVPSQIINIKFESGTASTGTVKCVDNVSGSGDSSEICTDNTNGSIVNGKSTYTHPAFTFGNEELTGFWMGKFEISGTPDLVTIKPGVTSLRNQTVSSFFNSIQKITSSYNLNSDSHMIKNMEWGAVVYLKQSKYGLGETEIATSNNGTTYYTGGGANTAYKTNTNQSTTGNIYGVYDMSGNAYEFTMSNMFNSNGQFYTGSSGFTSAPDSKYYDKYVYDASNYTTHSRGKLGDATKETLSSFGIVNGGWYGDYSYLVSSTNPWFLRGGYYNDGANAGMFSFFAYAGGGDASISSFAVLS